MSFKAYLPIQIGLWLLFAKWRLQAFKLLWVSCTQYSSLDLKALGSCLQDALLLCVTSFSCCLACWGRGTAWPHRRVLSDWQGCQASHGRKWGAQPMPCDHRMRQAAHMVCPCFGTGAHVARPWEKQGSFWSDHRWRCSNHAAWPQGSKQGPMFPVTFFLFFQK